MTHVVELDAIRTALADLDLLPRIEAAFVAYSEGRCVVPPVGELILERGEVHIKYGAIPGDEFYVIKIASGFPGNQELGLPGGNGLMLLFRQATGEPAALLDDRGHLTDVRTAAAGAVAAKVLAPSRVERIGILGTGVQARLQLQHLRPVLPCRSVLAWGRDREKLAAYRDEMTSAGFELETTDDPTEIGASCQLIVTTTAAREPVLPLEGLKSGTHVTAVGSDTPDKQELAGEILARADLVVADSIEQCLLRGEIHQALQAGLIDRCELVELGHVLAGTARGRTSDDELTVFDSTGVAVQDIAIAQAVLERVGP